MPVIYLIRHAQASFGGETYDVLSPLGERQSERLGTALSQWGVQATRTVTGALRRQRDTAAQALALDGSRLESDDRWNEYDAASVLAVHGPANAPAGPRNELGVPAGVSTRGFQALLDPALEAWVSAGEESESGESWPAFRQRGLSALDALATRLGTGDSALAFTSGGLIAAICTALLEAPAATFVALNRVSVNTGVSKVIYGGSGPRLVTFNEHSHLERELVTYR